MAAESSSSSDILSRIVPSTAVFRSSSALCGLSTISVGEVGALRYFAKDSPGQDFKRVRFGRWLLGARGRWESVILVTTLAEIGPAAMPPTATTSRIKAAAVVQVSWGWRSDHRNRWRNGRHGCLDRWRRYGGAGGGGATSAATGGGGSRAIGAGGGACTTVASAC